MHRHLIFRGLCYAYADTKHNVSQKEGVLSSVKQKLNSLVNINPSFPEAQTIHTFLGNPICQNTLATPKL